MLPLKMIAVYNLVSCATMVSLETEPSSKIVLSVLGKKLPQKVSLILQEFKKLINNLTGRFSNESLTEEMLDL